MTDAMKTEICNEPIDDKYPCPICSDRGFLLNYDPLSWVAPFLRVGNGRETEITISRTLWSSLLNQKGQGNPILIGFEKMKKKNIRKNKRNDRMKLIIWRTSPP